MSPLIVFISLLAIVLALLYVWAATRRDYWKNHGIPYVPSKALLGNFYQVLFQQRAIIDVLQEIYNDPVAKNQPFVGINIFHKPGLLIRSPEMLKRVLSKDFNYFSNKHTSSDPKVDSVGYHNLFLVKNPLWKQMRVKLTPVFSSGKIKQMYPLVEKVGRDLQTYMRGLVDKNTKSFTVNTKDMAGHYGIDVIASIAYGIDANCLTDPNAEFKKIVMPMFNFTPKRSLEFTSLFLLPEITTILRAKFFTDRVEKFLRKIFLEVMDQREKSNILRHDLIDVLVGLKNGDKNKTKESSSDEINFNTDILLAQAAVFITAGHESSSATVSYFLWEVSKKPEIQKRLRDEIKDTLIRHKGELTYETVTQEFKYLDMVINETLRFYPILVFHDRITTIPKGEKGYSLEPYSSMVLNDGVPIFIPVHAIHMDPQYYLNPTEFDPERFSPANKDKIQSFTYLPFGLGPHNCIGERFGLLQVKIALIAILREFAVEFAPETPRTIKFNQHAILQQSVDDLILKFVQDELFCNP